MHLTIEEEAAFLALFRMVVSSPTARPVYRQIDLRQGECGWKNSTIGAPHGEETITSAP
jgi:hypothetical protein